MKMISIEISDFECQPAATTTIEIQVDDMVQTEDVAAHILDHLRTKKRKGGL